MVEFAVVLVVKRKLEYDKEKSNSRPNELTSEEKLPEIEGMRHGFEKEGDEGTSKRRSAVKEPRCLKESDITNKIDFIAFVVLLSGYFVFNCVYCRYYTPF